MGRLWLGLGILCATTAGLSGAAASAETTCPRAGTLGVSRTVEIDTTGGPGFGMQHYKAYDFLGPKEVVLTFDDGPQKYTTEEVLKALADECVKATFFSIGKMALGYPEIIREVAKAGHTIGTHTWSHKALAKLKTFDEAKDEIERGISGVKRAVGGPVAPFFRFPTLVDTPEAIAYLGKRNIAIFSTDIDSFDFKPQTADHLVASLMQKLDKNGKGILLMHDIHKTTAKALPAILAQLKSKGYKIVHLTAKGTVTTLAEYDQAIEKEAKGLPQVGAERPVSSIVKTVGGTAPPEETGSSSSEPAGLPTSTSVSEPAGSALPASTGSLPAQASPPTAQPSTAGSPPPTVAPAATATPGSQSSAEPTNDVKEDSDMTATPSLPSAMAPASMVSAPTPAAPVPAPAVAAGTASGPIAMPPANAAAPGPVTMAPAVSSSVVRTVSGDVGPTPPSQVGETASKPSDEPHVPSKTLAQRAKETWELWFGQ